MSIFFLVRVTNEFIVLYGRQMFYGLNLTKTAELHCFSPFLQMLCVLDVVCRDQLQIQSTNGKRENCISNQKRW